MTPKLSLSHTSALRRTGVALLLLLAAITLSKAGSLAGHGQAV